MPKTTTVRVRLSTEERRAFKAAAATRGQTLSAWLREAGTVREFLTVFHDPAPMEAVAKEDSAALESKGAI